MSESPEHIDIPERLGQYRIIRHLNSGGMAKVYEGRRESIAGVQAKVAIKVIDPQRAGDQRFQDLFIQEAKVSSNLRHQNLIQIQDFDRVDKLFYLVMEYVEGVTIRSAIKRSRLHGIPIPLSLIAEIGRQICDGLHHAHKAMTPDNEPLGLVHRDIKPSNLMINPQGVIKVLDFGVSRTSIRKENPGSVRGTWGYMAPEQAAGEVVTPKTDLFGLAVVLYEMAALKPMFTRKEKINRVLFKKLLLSDEAARRATQLPNEYSELSRVLVRALQRDPNARFENAEEMGRGLSELVPDLVQARQALVDFEHNIRELAGKNERELSPYILDDSDDFEPPVQKRKPMDKQKWGFILTLTFPVLLALILFGVFRIIHSGEAGKEQSSVQTSSEEVSSKMPVDIPEPKTVTEESPPLKSKPKRKTKPAVTTVQKPNPPKVQKPKSTPPAQQQTTTEEVGVGKLTISADTSAKVFIDGQFVRAAPLYRHNLSAGNHRVHLAHADGRVKRFNVTIQGGQESIYVWSFFDDRWLRKQP